MTYTQISHGRSIDLTGKRFGKLTVLFCTKRIGNSYHWLCKCDCGNEIEVRSDALRNGNTRSCGCSRTESAHERKTKNSNDIIGQTFRNSIVVEQVLDRPYDEVKQHTTFFKCVCNLCGHEYVSSLANLRKNKNKNGCPLCVKKERTKNTRKKNDLCGRRFGKLTVIEQTDIIKRGSILYRCKCDCGNEILCNSYSLKHGHTKSCGCLTKEKASVNGIKNLQKSNGAISKWERKIVEFLTNINDVEKLKTQLRLKNKFDCSENQNYYYDVSFEYHGVKIIIECNGHMWHPSTPFEKWSHLKNKSLANDNYFRDFAKRLNAEEYGYDVFVVWDTEPLTETFKRIEQLLKTLDEIRDRVSM